MIKTRHLVIVGMAWISILYIVCFGAVAVYPEIRELFMKYALHVEMNFGVATITPSTFLAGFVLWNIITALALGLFAALFNRIRV